MGKTRPRDIGTQAETAVLKVLSQYWPTADRAPLRGNLDQGDILGTPYVWEVKGGHAAENASDGQIEKWYTETIAEYNNARAAAEARGLPKPEFAFLVTKRKGIGPKNAFDWWVHFHTIWASAIFGIPRPAPSRTPNGYLLRMRLGDLLAVLQWREGEQADGSA